jgi:hypothetical protein
MVRMTQISGALAARITRLAPSIVATGPG